MMCRSEMKFMCVVLLIITGFTQADKFEVVGPSAPVMSVSGEDVILPCSIKPNISAVNMRVEWFRLDQRVSGIVHLYEDHEDRKTDQLQSYRGRTQVFPEELKKGNTSLKLSRVQIFDEGFYKCYIQSTSESWSDDVTIELRVEAVGSVPVITVDGFDGSGGLHLQCESNGWNPEPELVWLNSEGVTLTSESSQTHRDERDGFSVKHMITVYNTDTKYHCRIRMNHHMMEAEIITSRKMFDSWRSSVILISLAVVLSVITGILIFVFIRKQRELHREKKREEEKIQDEEQRIQDEKQKIQDEKQRIQDEKQRIQDEKEKIQREKKREEQRIQDEEQRIQDEKQKIQREKKREEEKIQDEEQRIQNEKQKIQREKKREEEKIQDEEQRINDAHDALQMTVESVTSVLRKFAVNVTLDADSAHPRLIVSQDGKEVRCDITQQRVKNKEDNRFDVVLGVVGHEGFSSGCFYYEVQVKDRDGWSVGVMRQSAPRKGRFYLNPENRYWTVSLRRGDYWAGEDLNRLSLKVKPERIGVFVDHEKGRVSFYDVKFMTLIYSFTGQSFTEKLYPVLSLGYSSSYSSVPLIICSDLS